MWFPDNAHQYGAVDITAFKQAVLALPEEAWAKDEAKKKALAGDRPTQSIFFCYLSTARFSEIIKTRKIELGDIDVIAHVPELSMLLAPLLEFVQSHVPAGGLFIRAQLARMMPGAKINPHYDSDPILMSSMRMHIPIVTHDKLRFFVNDGRVIMQEGNLYLLNNQLDHWVENPLSASVRVHLIIDYLMPEFNNADVQNERLEFTVRANNAKRPKAKQSATVDMPCVIATSVVRGAHREESHGGVYLVDLKNDTKEQVVDWNTCDIDFSGRGWDRGLRGICISDKKIFIAATEAIYEFDSSFNIIESYACPYLRHAHEMMVVGKHIYITSTGFDSVLRFDLKRHIYDRGWAFSYENGQVNCKIFDPRENLGPEESNFFHINNVYTNKQGMYISGRRLGNLLKLKGDKIEFLDRVPAGTHNVMPFNKGILYNDSEGDQMVYSSNYEYRNIAVPRYETNELKNAELGDEQVARQAFGRGLLPLKGGLVIGGSSPSTISVYDLRALRRIKQINISMDIRNAIHGLEIWPH